VVGINALRTRQGSFLMNRPIFQPVLSLDTLLAASPLMGHSMEDRGPIRNAQDWEMVRDWQRTSSVRLSDPSQQSLFTVAPLDLLVTCPSAGTDPATVRASTAGEHPFVDREFHLLELNGTGIGGLTNMSFPAVEAVLEGMSQMAEVQQEQYDSPLILIASSGRECEKNPRLNKLIYEKVMYAEAFRRGFQRSGLSTAITTMPGLLQDASPLAGSGPAVVVGYIKEFLDALTITEDGRLKLFGRTVTGLVNDRFCLNVLNQYKGMVDLRYLATMNRCHLAGADKGVAYGLLNDFLAAQPQPFFPREVLHQVAESREELIATVMEWRRRGLQPVIKPQGTGLGHGIEFFLAEQSDQQVIDRIDRSIQLTQEFYRSPGGAFPYTVCQFVDACTVDRPGHPLDGHKYELRVVVYRDGLWLKAFPSIVKVAAEPVSLSHGETKGLINNITASCMQTQAKGTDFMFPLANRETLELFGLEDRHMRALCGATTRYVGFVLDQLQSNPRRLGLPAQPSASGVGPSMPSLPSPGLAWPRQNLLEPQFPC